MIRPIPVRSLAIAVAVSLGLAGDCLAQSAGPGRFLVDPADYSKTPEASPYSIHAIEPPAGVVLEVGGMDIDASGLLYMSTRRGQVWTYKDGSWRLFAEGLHEPLGVVCGEQGEIFVLQRPELSRIVDEDGDGRADVFEMICNEWGYTGNYHEFAIGLVRDSEGSFYINLGLSFTGGRGALGSWKKGSGRWLGGDSKAPWRGWHCKITKDGRLIPLAAGIRAPNGLGRSPEGEIFIADNQGSFVSAGSFYQPVKGDFLGQAEALIWGDGLIHEKGLFKKIETMSNQDRLAYLDGFRKRPVFYIPYTDMGNSCAHPIWDTTAGKFGPFAGQVIIGDINKRLILRGTYERVGGQYQGACYPLIATKALGGGNNRVSFTADGQLFVGQTARGWASGLGLKRIAWNGVPHMELQEVKLTSVGFDLYFTKPVKVGVARDAGKYAVTSKRMAYTNKYHDAHAFNHKVEVAVASVSEDGLRVSLSLSELVADRVYQILCPAVVSSFGEKVEFGKAYYTVNKLKPASASDSKPAKRSKTR